MTNQMEETYFARPLKWFERRSGVFVIIAVQWFVLAFCFAFWASVFWLVR